MTDSSRDINLIYPNTHFVIIVIIIITIMIITIVINVIVLIVINIIIIIVIIFMILIIIVMIIVIILVIIIIMIVIVIIPIIIVIIINIIIIIITYILSITTITITATFNTPFAALGQSPEGCSSYTFPRIMGEEVAKKVLAEGSILSSQDALQSGLVHCVLPEKSLIDVVKKYCHHISSLDKNNAELIRKMKKENIIDKLNEINLKECNELEKVVIGKKCFSALAKYLESRNMKMAAFVLR